MKISEIITPVNCKYGAPMGRPDRTPDQYEIITNKLTGEKFKAFKTGKICRKRVRLDSGGYDMGGAYWGLGAPLYVEFNKELTHIKFFRQ